MSDLKPCPFCGGPAEIWRASVHPDRAAWIGCMGRCSVLVSREYNTDEEAIAAWNTRTPTPTADQPEGGEDERCLTPAEQAVVGKSLRNSVNIVHKASGPTSASRETALVVIERDQDGKPTIWCDPEIADLVTALNAGGIRTIASCSGHGHRPGSIALADGRWLVIAKDDAEHDKIEAIFPIDINCDPVQATPASGEQMEVVATAWKYLGQPRVDFRFAPDGRAVEMGHLTDIEPLATLESAQKALAERDSELEQHIKDCQERDYHFARKIGEQEARAETAESQLAQCMEALEPFTKRAPVQGFSAGIPWDMHLRAYDAYCKKYSRQEALITGNCRGGFGTGELDMFIPGWRDEVAEDFRLARTTLAALQQKGGQSDEA